MIRDRLVIGIQDKNTKARLLRERALSLDKAVDMCKSSQVTISSWNQYKMMRRRITTNWISFVISVDQHKGRNLKTKRSLQVKRNLPINLGNASTVVSKRSMPSRLIIQHTDRNVEFARKWIRMCQSSKEKVHVAEEAEGYESEESLLQLEEIINK